MLVSRLFSKAAVFGAAVVVAGAGFAQAAVLGGANVNVTGNVVIAEGPIDFDTSQTPSQVVPIDDGMAFIEATGSFFAQSLIDDPDALSAFSLTADLTAGGRVFFDEEVITPTTSINGLLGIVGADFDDVFAAVTPLVAAALTNPTLGVTVNDTITGLFTGVELGLEISNTSATSNSIMGDFRATALVTDDQLDTIGFILQDLVALTGGNPINFEPSFAFEFNAEIAPIPLPAALPLLLSGVAFFGLMGWRRKAIA